MRQINRRKRNKSSITWKDPGKLSNSPKWLKILNAKESEDKREFQKQWFGSSKVRKAIDIEMEKQMFAKQMSAGPCSP